MKSIPTPFSPFPDPERRARRPLSLHNVAWVQQDLPREERYLLDPLPRRCDLQGKYRQGGGVDDRRDSPGQSRVPLRAGA